ncbi:sigma-70 family RNA polymerase sigma factor [uncultured Prevotella sp.]|uniref:RNA polymerase sigma factor n=1 Tax=uncultured Prevotella sp. TaxID=159272 RepID=UPI0026310AC0|nr:sigma-70 family RNA polymerase sigma factor [uncultured Prevotella sp.]
MPIDDNDIYTSMRRNPESGIRMVMQKYGEPVYWHARRLLVSHDDAQDAVQETFIKVYRSFHSLKEAKALRSWIYRIATNEALRFIERNKTPRLLTESIDDSATDIAATDYTDYTDLEAVKLQKAILSLPPKQQATFNMRYYDEMEYQQIAEAMETTVSTVKVNYHLAKEKIIKYMNSND